MQKFELSVTQLNNYIKAIFDNEEILFNIGVFGEVTNFKISNGNAYFDIKDDAATLSCLKFGVAGLDIKMVTRWCFLAALILRLNTAACRLLFQAPSHMVWASYMKSFWR